MTFEKLKKVYWFEHALEKFAGIFEYNSIEDLLCDVKEKFLNFEVPKDFEVLDFKIFEYKKPKFHISANEFRKYCEQGKEIFLEK